MNDLEQHLESIVYSWVDKYSWDDDDAVIGAMLRTPSKFAGSLYECEEVVISRIDDRKYKFVATLTVMGRHRDPDMTNWFDTVRITVEGTICYDETDKDWIIDDYNVSAEPEGYNGDSDEPSGYIFAYLRKLRSKIPRFQIGLWYQKHASEERGSKHISKFTTPWVRIAIMVVAVLAIFLIAYFFTRSVLPTDPGDALIFQNALLLVVLGSSLLEHKYTKPADSVVNSLMGIVTLLSVYNQAPAVPWFLIASYCTIVFIFSATCVAVSTRADVSGWREKIARFTYRPAVIFGKARVLFSLVFLSGLWFFYSVQEPITLALVLFWGIFIVLWPLQIPELISSWFERGGVNSAVFGEITRVDDPNIVRVALSTDSDCKWVSNEPKVCSLPNGQSQWLVPLYSQFQDEQLLATGLLTGIDYKGKSPRKNCIFEPVNEPFPTKTDINRALGGDAKSSLIGFIVENSSISAIRFETLNPNDCYGGMLVWAKVANRKVYYQIVSGETKEESFSGDKHGFQVATATQLGELDEQHGFKKRNWLPAMNTPVFTASVDSPISASTVSEREFKLGTIPESKIDIGGPFVENYNYHTALLGVTGSGKTELAFDLIKHSLDAGIKVVCIDLTDQYGERLSELRPQDLSISSEKADELGKKLFDAETGTYGAGAEKKVLEGFAKPLRENVTESVENFISNKNINLGLIRLEEISNTKATLWITELYMTCLLKYAKEHLSEKPKLLIVVEEAHTVMPEPNTMGLGDYDSRGLVGKIAQVALQGRKYGVGLLVLSQRTATVSKTVLTQCNTIISFTAYDDTSLAFLRNIFGHEYVSLIPTLPPLNAIAFGKWIKSEKPVIIQIPFDQNKADKS